MNKRGQFFLVAAFVIVSILISLTTVVNFVVIGEDREYFYDLSEEVGYETKRVMNYGTFKKEDVLLLTKNFISNYSNYIGKDKVIFIYGDNSNLEGLVFQQNTIGNVGIDTGGAVSFIPIQDNTGEEAVIVVEDTNVKVEIDGLNYSFALRDGQNLFYVIKQEEDDETLVAEG